MPFEITGFNVGAPRSLSRLCSVVSFSYVKNGKTENSQEQEKSQMRYDIRERERWIMNASSKVKCEYQSSLLFVFFSIVSFRWAKFLLFANCMNVSIFRHIFGWIYFNLLLPVWTATVVVVLFISFVCYLLICALCRYESNESPSTTPYSKNVINGRRSSSLRFFTSFFRSTFFYSQANVFCMIPNCSDDSSLRFSFFLPLIQNMVLLFS